MRRVHHVHDSSLERHAVSVRRGNSWSGSVPPPSLVVDKRRKHAATTILWAGPATAQSFLAAFSAPSFSASLERLSSRMNLTRGWKWRTAKRAARKWTHVVTREGAAAHQTTSSVRMMVMPR